MYGANSEPLVIRLSLPLVLKNTSVSICEVFLNWFLISNPEKQPSLSPLDNALQPYECW